MLRQQLQPATGEWDTGRIDVPATQFNLRYLDSEITATDSKVITGVAKPVIGDSEFTVAVTDVNAVGIPGRLFHQ